MINNYKELIVRIADEVGEKLTSEIRDRISDYLRRTIYDIFGRAEAPRKTQYYTLSEEQIKKEDFNSSVLEWGTISGGSISAGKWQVSNIESFTSTIKFEEVSQVKIKINTTDTVEIKIMLLGSNNEILFTDSSIISQSSTLDIDTDLIKYKPTKIKVEIEPLSTVDVDEIAVTYKYKSLQLPSDFYIPYQVKFYTSDGSIFVSSELLPEEFMRWHKKDLSADTDIQNETVLKYYSTEENFRYDNMIGYYFDYQDGVNYLRWNPAKACELAVQYAYIPLLGTSDNSITESDSLPLIETFRDLLFNGAVSKYLLWKTKFVKDQIEYYSIRSAKKDHDEDYKRLLIVFNGYFNRGVQNNIVRGFRFLSDTGMELA